MFPVKNVATTVLAEIIRRQPPSAERTKFAWTVAAGAELARAATVTLDGDTFIIRAKDVHWAREITRASDLVLLRLQQLLGRDAVREIRVSSARAARAPRASGLTPRTFDHG